MERLKKHIHDDRYRDLLTRKELGENAPEEDRWAISVLCDIGLLKKVSEQDLYHGRSKKNEDEVWFVDPNFDNADNNSNNRNVNKIPALNVASKEIAERFAEKRDWQNNGREVHKITSEDPLASTIDLDFSFENVNKNPELLGKYFKAIETLSPPISHGITFDFETKGQDIGGWFKSANFNNLKNAEGYIENDSIKNLIDQTEIDERIAKRAVEAKNAETMIRRDPLKVIRNFIDNNLEENNIGLDEEYIRSFLEKSHIVGANRKIISATLEGEEINAAQFFNLHEINTDSALAAKRVKKEKGRSRILGSAALNDFFHEKQVINEKNSEFWASIEDLSSEPKKMIDVIELANNEAKNLFSKDAGNWEKYTVRQHTETVMQNFENNYADIIPSGLVPLTRLALIMHDIGKGNAVENGEKYKQKDYNKLFANRIMQQLGTNQQINNLICGMISDAQIITTEVLVKKNKAAEQDLTDYSINLLKACGFKNINDDDATIVSTVCKIIQTCDSMAYTTIGIVRDFDEKRFHSSDSFNQSFIPYGFTNKKGRWK